MNAVVRRLATPAVVGTGLVAVLGAGVATAYYGSTVAESATGSATPTPVTPVTLAATGSASAGLYPGGPGANVTVTITNPYTRAVTISGVAPAGTVTAAPVAGQTCATHGVTVTAPASGLPVTVPASSTSTVTLAGVVQLGGDAENGCQGAAFTIPFQVTGRL